MRINNGLLGLIKACNPEKVILMHSDDREPLARDIRAMNMKVLLPVAGEEMELVNTPPIRRGSSLHPAID